LEEISWR